VVILIVKPSESRDTKSASNKVPAVLVEDKHLVSDVRVALADPCALLMAALLVEETPIPKDIEPEEPKSSVSAVSKVR